MLLFAVPAAARKALRMSAGPADLFGWNCRQTAFDTPSIAARRWL